MGVGWGGGHRKPGLLCDKKNYNEPIVIESCYRKAVVAWHPQEDWQMNEAKQLVGLVEWPLHVPNTSILDSGSLGRVALWNISSLS